MSSPLFVSPTLLYVLEVCYNAFQYLRPYIAVYHANILFYKIRIIYLTLEISNQKSPKSQHGAPLKQLQVTKKYVEKTLFTVSLSLMNIH